MKTQSVFETLNGSNASLKAEREIHSGLKLALWENRQDHVIYNTGEVHTLSLYLVGGYGCQRLDAGNARGAPGTLCLIPCGEQSEWLIRDEFRFMHLYFTDERIKRFAARVLDKEPQCVTVPDLTFHSDQKLATLVGGLHGAMLYDDPLSTLEAQELANDVFFYLLNHGEYCLDRGVQLRGGLSPQNTRRVLEYIHNHYADNPTLSELADLVNLSEYHFQRMFRRSHGVSPHNYLTEVRLNYAQQMIRSGKSLAKVAIDCGFSHQSHLNRIFRKSIGLTPGQYAACIRESKTAH